MSVETPIALYSRRARLYGSLIRYLGYQNGIERVFRTSIAHALLPGARVLDAGCGAGAVTFARQKAVNFEGEVAEPADDESPQPDRRSNEVAISAAERGYDQSVTRVGSPPLAH